jgi:SAM-dependent methyltransferase
MDTHQYHEIAELDERNWWYRSRRALVDRLIGTYANAGGSALDLGCGTGAHAALLQTHFSRVTGVDPSREALQHASSRGYDALVQSGAEALPLPDGSESFVLATDVLEHVNDRAALREIKRVLMQEGTVVVTVPAFMSLWHGNDDHSHHLRRYSMDELCARFREQGFTIVYVGYWNRLFFIPVWLIARMYRNGSSELRNNLSSIPSWMNPMLTAWMAFENAFCRIVPIPFGVSLALVAKK